MPCLSNKYDPAIGAVINIGVLFPGSIAPGLPAPSQISAFPALIDTGASSTCISNVVAQIVGLHPMGMRPMSSATESKPVNVYLIDLILPFGASGLIMPGAQVMEFTPVPGSPYQILLGRDVICKGVLTMSFDGQITFSV